MSVNRVIILGNAGKDPEVRHLESGASVANFTVATSERFKDKSGNLQERTEWHNIVCWRQLADFAEKFVKKGSQVFIEGRIRTRDYTDQTGQKRYVTEIFADTLQLTGRKSDNTSGQEPSKARSQSTQTSKPMRNEVDIPAPDYDAELDSVDDLPF